ncbi:MAG TPA: CPBP family intramembrane glutamic endopeptidase [Polyangiaceae bacterium]|nr:CPBP family intramembrane glutamic endopeptidase [Polyangiaceae bacterium]
MMNSLFFTHERRLRLGFRLALAFVVYAICGILREVAKLGMHAAGASRPVAMTLAAVLEISAYLGATMVLRRRVDLRPWAGMALPPPAKGARLFFLGGVLGTALLLVVVGIELAARWIEVGRTDATTFAAYLVAGLAISLAVGFIEELLFRGYFLQNLGEEIPLWAATLLTGVFFAAIHMLNGGFGVEYIVSAIAINTLFALMRVLSGSLWLGIGFHAAWDWAQTLLVGLSVVNNPAQDHSLFRVAQHGPTWMVGDAPSIEGGLLFPMIFLLSIAGICGHAFLRGRPVGWRARLGPEGTPVA